MERTPSLHISQQNLVKVLKELDVEHSPISAKKLAKLILQRSKKYSLTNRVLISKTQKTKKKTSKLLMSGIKDAESFAKLTQLIRKQKKHRGINIVKVGSKDWVFVKEVTKLAIDFCTDFNLDSKMGFKRYIELALSKMKKFSWMKFNNLHQSICVEYEAILEIEEDETPKESLQVCNIYERILMEGSGISHDYKNMPEKYVYFVKVKHLANGLQVTYYDYVKAQFYALEYMNGIPDPSQMVGDKAIQRVQTYLMKHKPKQKESRIDYNKISKK